MSNIARTFGVHVNRTRTISRHDRQRGSHWTARLTGGLAEAQTAIRSSSAGNPTNQSGQSRLLGRVRLPPYNRRRESHHWVIEVGRMTRY